MKFQDLTGQRFGRLLVLSCVQKAHVDHTGRRHHTEWNCACDCGNTHVAKGSTMKNGDTRSCGCLHSEAIGALRRTHGMSKLPEYRIWSGILRRVLDHEDAAYHRYGGRGIKIDDLWANSFEQFFADMSPRPSPKHSVERKDNDGPYAPWNCVWATREEQANNTRSNVWVTFRGVTKTLAQWCRELGHAYNTISARIQRYGWTPERALTTPSGMGRGGQYTHALQKNNDSNERSEE